MQTELPKETLTKEAIRHDLRQTMHGGIVASVLVLLLLLPLCIALVWLVWTKSDQGIPLSQRLDSTVMLVLTLVIAAVCVKETIRYGLLLYGKQRYYITTAKLVHIRDKVGEYRGRYSEPYILTFSTNGEYAIPKNSYNWSEMYNLSYSGFSYYSHIGDEFYLVVDKRGKILVAYNTKLFKLQDQ